MYEYTEASTEIYDADGYVSLHMHEPRIHTDDTIAADREIDIT